MKQYRSILVVLVLALSASAVHALPVEVRLVNIDPAKSIYVSHPYANHSMATGVHNVKIGLLDGNPRTLYQGFCIDLKQDSSATLHPYEVTSLDVGPLDGGTPYSPMGVSKADAIRELWGEHYAEATTSALNAAAFQTAIWEIIYENSNEDSVINTWDAASGRFKITHVNAATLANTWLAAIGDDSRTLDTTLVAVVNDTSGSKFQDYVVSMGFGGVIPEPVTVVTAILSLCGLGAYVRKRTRK